ncbi:MAG: patatin-like phospholipase family protein [Hyphomicrobiales bacterium]
MPQGYWLARHCTYMMEMEHKSPRIGLALGGGAARGLAHIAMLEAFDEAGLKPTVIAGSSMGALVGALYASGMSASDIRKHAETRLSNRVDFARYVFGARRTRPFDLISLGGLASLHLDGEKLVDLALPDTLPANIEDTLIPLKVIATDYERMEEVVLEKGSLQRAVGASIAIPGLIAGPRINGRLHVDGGVVNPVPFDHVRAGNDIVIAIDVTGRPRPMGEGRASNIEMAVGSLLIMFHKLAEFRRIAGPPDVYISPSVDKFGAGDFFRVKEILAAAEPAKQQLAEALRQIKARVAA